jgi:hypothetical protein
LDHPNIVSHLRNWRHEGQHYLSMKLVEGSTLSGDAPEPAAGSCGRRQKKHVEPADAGAGRSH